MCFTFELTLQLCTAISLCNNWPYVSYSPSTKEVLDQDQLLTLLHFTNLDVFIYTMLLNLDMALEDKVHHGERGRETVTEREYTQ